VIRSVLSFVVPLRILRVVFVLLFSTPLFATADVPKSKNLACGLTAVEAARLNVDPSVDVRALSEYKKAIYVLLQSRRFNQLDCLADSARSQKEMFPGGAWKLHTMYLGLEKPPLHPTLQDWTRHMALVREWVSLKPKSITPRVVLAESYVSYGWDARGSGQSESVSKSGWKLFGERAKQAMQVLKEARSLPKKCPEIYVALQQVAQALEWDPNAKRALLDEAAKFEPGYYYYYRSYATSTLPKWDGQAGDTEKFMKSAADRVGGDAGDILYFQVASYLACCETDEQLKLSWPRIQNGFRSLEKRSGPALENTNYMARLASIYQDPLVANRMLNRIGEQWSEEIWRTSTYFESVKQWAKGMSSAMEKQNEEEEAAEASLRTPEGQQYKSAVGQKIESLIPECVKTNGAPRGNFEMLLHIRKDGMIDNVTTVGLNRVGSCVLQKLQATRPQNQAAFPPPPKPDYWVRYDLIPEDLSSQAMR
jgi:hypothetical protein